MIDLKVELQLPNYMQMTLTFVHDSKTTLLFLNEELTKISQWAYQW